MSFSMAAEGSFFDIGAFDAKTYFSELLRKVQEGAVFNISKNGKPVAVLQGVQNAKNTEAQLAHKRILSRAKKMQHLQEINGLKTISATELKELKNGGRKY